MGRNTDAAAKTTPQPRNLNRQEILDLFIHIVNTCRPDHPYRSNPYPVTQQNIDYSYCRESSNIWARCGPRNRGQTTIFFAIDQYYFKNRPIERLLAVLTHEITHLTIGTHNGKQAPMHPPHFWNQMAFHTQQLLDNFNTLNNHWGPIDPDHYRQKIIKEPNNYTVDQRSDTPTKAQNRLKKFVNTYPTNTP